MASDHRAEAKIMTSAADKGQSSERDLASSARVIVDDKTSVKHRVNEVHPGFDLARFTCTQSSFL
jgi:hypothetical protein